MKPGYSTVGRPLIIRSRLSPPAQPDPYVDRPRLRRLIGQAVSTKRVVVVTATAGSGKTTAVAETLRRLGRPFAWLTVDRPDRAAGRLLTYLQESLGGAVQGAGGTATRALASGVSHIEAAGLLAEAIGQAPPLGLPVIVLDELERLGEQPEPWQVIEALVRYAPRGTCVTMISRRDIPTDVCALPALGEISLLADDELALTAEEAEEALAQTGRCEIDARAAVEHNAGWLTGVLFRAWHSSDKPPGVRADTDLLYDYISSQILGQLEPAQRNFLVETSLLHEVTAARACALGVRDAHRLLDTLRVFHLPATWDGGGRALRCHPYFREYLLEELNRKDEDEVQRLRLAFGRRLADEGLFEDATEELLHTDALEEALEPAKRAIIAVVERLDLSIARRWLDELCAVEVDPASPLTEAEFLIALATDDIGRGVRLADRLAAQGARQPLAQASQRAALLMVWCYLHAGRVQDVDEVLDAAEPGPATRAMRYARDALFGMGEDGPPVAPDGPSAGPFGAIVCNADYPLGRLSYLVRPAVSRWVETIERPWRVAALRARGQTDEALRMVEEARARVAATPTLRIFAWPEVLMDAGRWQEAQQVIAEARQAATATGSLAYEGTCGILQAKLELRFNRDTAAARAALGDPACVRCAQAFPYYGELAGTWHGLCDLLDGENEEALTVLRSTSVGMVNGDRMLELPTAAIYLAEAEWRLGNEDAADVAADLALHAASRQGSRHVLLQALADFPAVLSRRLDAEPRADSAWHDIARAFRVQRPNERLSEAGGVQLREFGEATIFVEGAPIRPRTSRSSVMLAYLLAQPAQRAERKQLVQALFDDRDLRAAQSYFRQALYWLRSALPENTLRVDRQTVAIGEDAGVSSQSVILERRLAEAARLEGADRLAGYATAICIYEHGDYLPGAQAEWVEERRRYLADLVSEARYQAAQDALRVGRNEQARSLVGQVLASDPFRESAWRLLMRINEALGDDDGILRTYQDCEQALAAARIQPATSTRQLLASLRH